MYFKNSSFSDFFSETQGKKIVAFGASEYCRVLCAQFSDQGLEDRIYCFLDNDKAKQNSCIKLNHTEIPVYSPDKMLGGTLSDIVILITTTVYAYEVFQELSTNRELDEIVCYALPLIVYQTQLENARSPKKLLQSALKEKQRIPKVIHSCWFSGEEKPDLYQRCVASWKTYCPDYQIIEWTQDNYNVNKNLFMRQALEAKKWAAVSDYARLDLVYRYGGIYMDMDLELIKSLDDILMHKAYFSFDSYNCIELGASFGAEAGTPFLKNMMDQYEETPYFDGNGGYNLTPQPIRLISLFQKAGLKADGRFQMINEMAFYPMEYFCPVNIDLGLSIATEDTLGIHHFRTGWLSSGEEKKKQKRLDGLRKLLSLAENQEGDFQ